MMNEPALALLTQRLNRLEREARWWRRIGVGLLLAALAITTMAQAPLPWGPKIVQAERFVLVDGNGDVRGEMGMDGGGMARLVMRAPGSGGAYVLLNPGGLALHDAKDPHLWINSSGLSVLSGKTKASIRMRLNDRSEPTLAFADENGIVRAQLGNTTLQDEKLGTIERSSASSLVLFDRGGKVIWKVP
jgi:hypothetical protein